MTSFRSTEPMMAVSMSDVPYYVALCLLFGPRPQKSARNHAVQYPAMASFRSLRAWPVTRLHLSECVADERVPN